MATRLAEPVVLAAAKAALYPDIENRPRRYAVTDTQFTLDSWGSWPVPSSVHEQLRPFNALRFARASRICLESGHRRPVF